MTTAQSDWRLAGEGNANIVLTYCGSDPMLVRPSALRSAHARRSAPTSPSSPAQRGMAIRYAKAAAVDSASVEPSPEEVADGKVRGGQRRLAAGSSPTLQHAKPSMHHPAACRWMRSSGEMCSRLRIS
jgi:hypothetical protein